MFRDGNDVPNHLYETKYFKTYPLFAPVSVEYLFQRPLQHFDRCFFHHQYPDVDSFFTNFIGNRSAADGETNFCMEYQCFS